MIPTRSDMNIRRGEGRSASRVFDRRRVYDKEESHPRYGKYATNNYEMKLNSNTDKRKRRARVTFGYSFKWSDAFIFLAVRLAVYLFKPDITLPSLSSIFGRKDYLPEEFQEYNLKFTNPTLQEQQDFLESIDVKDTSELLTEALINAKRSSPVSDEKNMSRKLDNENTDKKERNLRKRGSSFDKKKVVEVQDETSDLINFIPLTSSFQKSIWGNGVASCWAELPFPLHASIGSVNSFLAEPLILSTWVYISDSNDSDDRVIFISQSFTNFNVTQRTIIKVSILDGYLRLTYRDNNHVKLLQSNGHHEVLPFHHWIHIGLIMEKSSSDLINVKMYLNGLIVRVGSLAFSTSSLVSNGETIFGRDYDGKSTLEGYLSMFGVWNGEISKENYNTFMRSVYRSGMRKESLLNLDSQGLAKSPSLFYTFQTTQENSLPALKFNDQLVELVSNKHGIVKFGVHFQPHSRETTKLGTYKENKNWGSLCRLRKLHIKAAMARTIRAYFKHSLGQDELAPLSKSGHVRYGNFATTLVESLDSLWLMGLMEDFSQAKHWIQANLTFQNVDHTSLYDVTSKIVGGLISAYDLSTDLMFLKKAAKLAEDIYPAFSTPSGIPYSQVNINEMRFANSVLMRNVVPLSEIGSVQLEFRYLSKVLNEPVYAKAVERVYNVLDSIAPDGELYPRYLKNEGNSPVFVGQSNLFSKDEKRVYENILKVYIQGGRNEFHYRKMYDKAIDNVMKNFLRITKYENLTFIAEGSDQNKMSEAMCGFAGTLALGAYTHPIGITDKIAQRDLRVAEQLALTCYQMYTRSKSGLAPEAIVFDQTKKQIHNDIHFSSEQTNFNLESDFSYSLFVLFKLTRNKIYQEWGWSIFESIENSCHTGEAYASLVDVNDLGKGFKDQMRSGFTSKTLKYLYLLQDNASDTDVLKYIFNSAGHPIRATQYVEKIKWNII